MKRRLKGMVEKGQDLGNSLRYRARDAVMEKTSTGVLVGIARYPGSDEHKLVKIKDGGRKPFLLAVDAEDLKNDKGKDRKVGDTVEYVLYRDKDFKVGKVRYGSLSDIG